MPLPKSITCSSCKKTYPEGWKRCPYCGHDELRLKSDQQNRKFMERKVREFEQRLGKVLPKEGGGQRRGQQPKQRGGRPQAAEAGEQKQA
ncbi:MAG: hypothetical protein WA208_11230, partial [Thermoanaerobaculia bacterium]